MSDTGGINYTARRTAVKKAAEEVTRALTTISDIFKSFQEDYLAVLLENENLRNLVKKTSPPSSTEISKILKTSPKKKKSPPTSPKVTSPPPIPRTISSPIILSSQEYAETPGIVETTQFPIKTTPSKLQRVLQQKKALFTSSTASKPSASRPNNIQPWPTTSNTQKNSQSQPRILSLSRKNVSTRINSSGKVEKQTTLVLQPLNPKTDLNSTITNDLDPEDLEIDETMFEKAFTQEERVDVIESSPTDDNLRKKRGLRIKKISENKSQQLEKQSKICDDIILSDFEYDDMVPSLSQIEMEAVGIDKKREEKILGKEKKSLGRSKSPVLVENINFMNFGRETKEDMDETYFPRGESLPNGKKITEQEDNSVKRKVPDGGPSNYQKVNDKIFEMDLDGDWDTDISMDKWTLSPPQKKQVLNSFDIIPEKKKTSPKFAYKGPVVRNKAERAKLTGWACRECEVYYENMDLTEKQMRERMNKCSRHRSKFNERYQTPPGFWNPVIEDTPPSQRSIHE